MWQGKLEERENKERNEIKVNEREEKEKETDINEPREAGNSRKRG